LRLTPAKAPIAMQAMLAKMPNRCYALILVIDGRVENPEFVVWDRDSFNEELWKTLKKGIRAAGTHIEFYARMGTKDAVYRFRPTGVAE
jgi:hypothetical protein